MLTIKNIDGGTRVFLLAPGAKTTSGPVARDGAYREVTTEQLVNICTVAGGRTRASSPDFRMNRKMYLFDSWQPMHDAIEAARKAVS